MIQIVDWEKHYENNRTRELRRMEWVPIPNRLDGAGYRALIQGERGIEVFAAWILMLELASKAEPRGLLVRGNGEPHTALSMANATGVSEEIFAIAIERLMSKEIGWISNGNPKRLGKAFPAGAAEKKRAHGRVNRAFEKGDQIMTPFGPVSQRPDSCQWCGSKSHPGARQTATTIAHHLEGYGNYTADRYVIFVCRSCHQLFEHNRITTDEVHRRISQGPATPPQIPADTRNVLRTSAMEWKGMEGNGKEGVAMSLASSYPTPQALRSVLEKIARDAGIGTAFITPDWWSDVRLLHIRDGVEPESIARAFSVCVETNPAKVDFFARDFPRYVLPITKSEHVNPPAGVLEEMRHREEARRLRDDPEAQRKVAEICESVPWKKMRSASEAAS